MKNILKSFFFAGALLSAAGLAGCASYDSLVAGLGAKVQTGVANINTSLLATNQALAAAAPSVSSLVASIQTADGYFNTIAATGALGKAAQTAEANTMAVVNAIAANPPSSVASVANALAAALTNVQNLSQVPTQTALTVPVVAIPATPVSASVKATTVVAPVPTS